MTTQLSPLPVQRFYDNNNNPLAGGRLYTYIAGTTTPKPTYVDSTGVTANTNPVVMNARGEANVWLASGQPYKFVLKDASDVLIWTVDQVNNVGGSTISVKDFGAVGDGATNDTAAIQAAINFCGSGARRLWVPTGNYVVSGLTIAAGNQLSIVGENELTCNFLLNTTTGTTFTVSTDAAVTFDSLMFGYLNGATGTAGAFISVPGAVSGNNLSQFRNLQMNYPFVGISVTGAHDWSMQRVTIGEYINTAVIVANTFVADAGDSSIDKCTFTTASTAATGVLMRSAGGLRIINSKINGGAVAYQLSLDNAAMTSDLLITGNSIEGQSAAAIAFRRNGATGVFNNITITGNQFAGAPVAISCTDASTGWLGSVVITGNSIHTTGGTSINFNVGDSIIIDGNYLGGTGVESAIAIAAACTNVRIGVNGMTNYLTPIVNASPSTTIAKKVYQQATAGIVCNVAYGSLFAGSLSVPFPTGFFQLSPVVTATAVGGTNGVSATVSTVSGTGCVVSAIATTNGAAVQVFLRAEADY